MNRAPRYYLQRRRYRLRICVHLPRYGCEVDLINTRDRLPAFLDPEMSDSLSYHFWNSGVVIRHNEEYEKIEGCIDGVMYLRNPGKTLEG